jgi:hypothetical protein
MKRAVPHRRRELGGYLFESFFHSLLLLFMLFFTVFVFAAGVNTLIAARAQNETMIYAAGGSVWTGRAAERCVRMLPGPVSSRECRLYRQDPADPTRTLEGPLPELCADQDFNSAGPVSTDYAAAEGLRQNPPVFQGSVQDCLNEVGASGRFTRNSDPQGRPQPMRLEITYRQWFFNLCPFIPHARSASNPETTRPDVEDCQSRSSHLVTRSVVFYSQTVREQ